MVTKAEAEKFFVATLKEWAPANGHEIPVPRDAARIFFEEVEHLRQMDFKFNASSKWHVVEGWLNHYRLWEK